ncbi:hypothetical protein B5K08_32015 [Rhizobium leguminosarum bv. trifolii]|uniref:Uncharacterized protein n=1 Tax=Rhizobium leguminosarum bv. trifolii TaxID=386 RepID=A0A3E1AZ93_RHILT|nr:hypothetical protein [Rhizobium leguminosarum]RFB82324.1 hypothetical protein B5K10_32010 [Rhizobium leguminosarum bv. trifolii]RFB82828.1 hypothetical protein B5K08_32015 [Rhizobium leguminosarum bv. trifolii]
MTIDKAHAKRIVDLVISMDPIIKELLDEVWLVQDAQLSSELKHSITEIMGHAMLGILVPLEQIFPDLNPDK